MKVYVDTNVIVDFCLERQNKYELRYLFAYDFFKRGKDCEFYMVISDWAGGKKLC
ncbi:MAG: hypothetical protein ACOCZ6_05650 [Nanoarchaeota archaeon]